MAEDDAKQEGQKTIIAFIAGLLIGGLLVWVFVGTPDDNTANKSNTNNEMTTTTDDGSASDMDEDVNVVNPNDNETSAPRTEQEGDASIDVRDQPAGRSVAIAGAAFPNDEGWIAVRSYENGQFGNILGAARFSRTQGLIPDSVPLLVPTVAGRTYAVVFFTENGDRVFNLASDVQVEGTWETFDAE